MTTPQTPVKVVYTMLAVDPYRAGRFYEEALGAKVAGTTPDGGWTVMDIAGREVCLHGHGDGKLVDTGLAVEVDDLEQACAAIETAGGNVLRPVSFTSSSGEEMKPDWLAIVTDTEGNRFCVVRRGGCILHPSLFPAESAARA